MPKDKNLGKHKSRFEVRGGVINEFDFHNNQGAMAAEEQDRFARQEDERRLREGEAEADAPQTKSLTKQKRPGGQGAASGTKKGGAKNSATKAGEKGSKKAAATKKGAAGKTAGTKGGAKKGRAGATRKASRAR